MAVGTGGAPALMPLHQRYQLTSFGDVPELTVTAEDIGPDGGGELGGGTEGLAAAETSNVAVPL